MDKMLLKPTQDDHEESHGPLSYLKKNTTTCRPKKSHNILQFPNHIIVEILSKIPITYLLRCRCVCKSWRCLLSDHRVIKYLFSRTQPCLLFKTGRNPDQAGHFLVEFDNKSSPNAVQLKLSNDGIVGSCNGFLCVQDLAYDVEARSDGLFYLSNPVTGELLPLPIPSKQFRLVHYAGFGFSPVSGVYKLIVFDYSLDGSSEVMVLTVGSGVWRSIGDSEPYLITFPERGIYLNGFLHWLSSRNAGAYYCTLLCCFDVESERFQELPLPRLQLTEGSRWEFGVLKDCLCVTVRKNHNISVWVMKEYGVAESWTLEFDITVAFDASLPGTQVLKLTDRGDLLLLHQGQLMAYNPGKGVVEVVEVDGLPSVAQGFLHIPSFVSPKQIMEPEIEIN